MGRTALHWAALGCSRQALELLLASCMWDPRLLSSKDNWGYSALDYANLWADFEATLTIQNALHDPEVALGYLGRQDIVVGGVRYEP